MKKSKNTIRGLLAGLLVLGALLVTQQLGLNSDIFGFAEVGATGEAGGSTATAEGAQVVAEAFEAQRSGFMVVVAGTVDRVLADDLDGDPHQRFVLLLPNDHSLLVAHNIELAPRVPLKEDDHVELHGQYEWNKNGGVLHWTHHDPAGRHAGGWIRLAGRVYE